MIGRRQVRTRRALVHYVQQQHAFLAVGLELFQAFALFRRGALYLEELNLVDTERFRYLFHEVGELNKDEDTLVGRDALPTVTVSERLTRWC